MILCGFQKTIARTKKKKKENHVIQRRYKKCREGSPNSLRSHATNNINNDIGSYSVLRNL